MSEKHKKFIWIISAGLGIRDYLTFKAYNTAEKMDLLVGSRRFSTLFEHKNYIVLNNFSKDLDDIIMEHSDKKIGIVVSGDAGFYSLAKLIYKKYADNIAEVIPGISSFSMAFAKLKDSYENYSFYSLHSNSADLDSVDFKHKERIVVLCGSVYTPKAILDEKRWLLNKFDVFVGCNLSLENEKIKQVKNLGDVDFLGKCGLSVMILKGKNDG